LRSATLRFGETCHRFARDKLGSREETAKAG
jgi:hypothetical protein